MGLRAEHPSERLYERVARRLAWPRDVERDATRLGPQNKFARHELNHLIDADHPPKVMPADDTFEHLDLTGTAQAKSQPDRRLEPAERIDDGQDAAFRPQCKLIVHDVHLQDPVRAWTRRAIRAQSRRHAALRYLVAHLQT